MGMIANAIPPNPNIPRYHGAIILLHWVMAIAITLMLMTGITMVYIELEKSWQFQLYQWHKSGGILLMMALAVRIALRIITAIPPLPAHFSKVEQMAAKLGHLGLYLIMATMVFSGWTMVSSSAYGLPTVVFGWFEWPHIAGIQANQTVERLSKDVHFFSAIALGLLLVGHVGAVIKHYIIDRENLLTRMWWRRESKPQTATSSFKVFLLAVSTVVFIVVIFRFTIFSPSQSPLSTASNTSSVTAPNTAITAHSSYDFIVDTSRSQVSFSGTHIDNPFTGVFNEWRARLHFNPDALSQSHIHATFVTDSVNTGNAMYDGTLPGSDWFASDSYPQAIFTSDTIAANRNTTNQQDSYRVSGMLTLRNISKPLTFDMHIHSLNATAMQFNATFTIDRLAYEIGKSSDPDADWVSRNIDVQLEIQADRN